jgi:hypothetical protein
MTYVNHRDTENPDATQKSLGTPLIELCAFSVLSVSLWLTYVIRTIARP